MDRPFRRSVDEEDLSSIAAEVGLEDISYATIQMSYRCWRKNRTGVRVFGGKFLHGSEVAAATSEPNRVGVPTYPLDHNNIVRLYGFSKEISGVVGRSGGVLFYQVQSAMSCLGDEWY